MSRHLGIKKTLNRVVADFFFFFFFFGLKFVAIWQGVVNLATFVRGLFRKFMSLRYFWDNYH